MAPVAGLHGTKMIMVIMLEGKVIMRLPSTGGKVIKVITWMEMGDTLDRYDSLDSFRDRQIAICRVPVTMLIRARPRQLAAK